MPRYFLHKLEVEGFRGINNEGEPLALSFSTAGVNSVFGHNGLGKSSLFEALSYAIKGVVPKLDELPAAEDAPEYYGNRFHSTGDSVIILTARPDDASGDVVIRVRRASDGKRTVDSRCGAGEDSADRFPFDGLPSSWAHIVPKI